MNRIFVTGATGFIGRHCLPLLAEKGYEIYAVSTRSQPTGRHAVVHWLQVDLLGQHRLRELMAEIRPTYLLHLAWVVAPGKWSESLENFRWVQASLDLLLTFLNSGGRRVVMAGSCAEYDWKYAYCTEDLTPRHPQSVYGTCKNALQEMLFALTQASPLSGAWGRIFFLYGPHEHPARLVPSVIGSLLAGKPAECTHGRQIRDYLHVKDAAAALVALLESRVSGPVNIASGCPVTLKNLIYTIAHKLDRTDLVRLGALPAPENEPDFLVANTDRLSRQVGWQPQYSLETGLEDTIRWWRDYGMENFQ